MPAGGCLGGGSSINFLVYVRPQEIDFDDWKTEGWSGKEMISFFKKVCPVKGFFSTGVYLYAPYIFMLKSIAIVREFPGYRSQC